MDFGAQHAGIINVPIYPTISPLEYEYILNDAEVQYVFVSDRLLWRKINQVRDKVPSLKEIYSFEQIDETPNYRNILRDADGELDKQIAEIKNNIQPGDLATIIYTSGTTGNPKGVMLSHHNIVSNTKSCLKWVPLLPGDVVLSFLPVCHVFERTLIYTYYVAGANIYFADGLETISEHFPDIRPHWFSTVPRLLEKVYEKIIKKGQALEGFQKKCSSGRWSWRKNKNSARSTCPGSLLQMPSSSRSGGKHWAAVSKPLFPALRPCSHDSLPSLPTPACPSWKGMASRKRHPYFLSTQPTARRS